MASVHRSKHDFQEEFLHCSICKDPFDNDSRVPKCLPCLHCFCKSCLGRLVNNHQVTCPHCRKVYEVPPNGVDGFVTNFNVENLREYQSLHAENASTSEKQKQLCNNCSSGSEASGYCYECECFVCKACINVHETMRGLKSHDIIPLDEYNKSARKKMQGKCRVHEKNVCAFCVSCKKPICYTCGITTHNNHQNIDLPIAIGEAVRTLQNLTTEVRCKIKPLETLLEAIDAKINDINATCTERETEIDGIFAKINAWFEDRCKQSKDELREKCQVQVKILKEQKNEVDALRAQFESASDFAEQTCEFADPVQLFIHHDMVKERLEDLITAKHTGSTNEPRASSNIMFNEDHYSVMDWLETDWIACVAGMHFRNTSPAMSHVADIKPTVYTGSTHRVVVKAVNCNGEHQKNGGDIITAYLSLQDETTESCEIVDNANGTYTISYSTTKEGDHRLYVSLFGHPIKSSPFAFTAVTPDEAMYTGMQVDLLPAFMGYEQQIKLNISTTEQENSQVEPEVGLQRVTATIVSQTGESVACTVKRQKDNNYHILFKPSIDGQLSMNISVNGIPSIDNPYIIPVLPVCPKATSTNIGKPVSNQKWSIKVTPRNNRHEISAVPDNAVELKVINSETEDEIEFNCSRNNEGEFVYTSVSKSGTYRVITKLCNHLINMSDVDVLDSLAINLSKTPQSNPSQITRGQNNDIYVSDTQNNAVYSYNQSGLQSSTTRCETNKVSQISVDAQGRIILLFPQLQMVQVIDQQGNGLYSWSCRQQNIRPAGISLISDGRIFITDSKGPSMLVYKSDGEITSKFKLPKGSLADGMTNVCADNNNSIILAHHTDPRIYIYSGVKGQIKHNFHSRATSFQLAIATSKNDLLVAQLGIVRVIRLFEGKPQFLREIATAGDLFTSIVSTNDGCFFGLDVSKKRMVKYGYQ